MSPSNSSAANEFVKGSVWGFVAAVHFAAIMVVIYKLNLNCMPAKIVEMLACTPPDSARCAIACDPSNDMTFYFLAIATIVDFIMMPIVFGTLWVVRSRRARAVR